MELVGYRRVSPVVLAVVPVVASNSTIERPQSSCKVLDQPGVQSVYVVSGPARPVTDGRRHPRRRLRRRCKLRGAVDAHGVLLLANLPNCSTSQDERRPARRAHHGGGRASFQAPHGRRGRRVCRHDGALGGRLVDNDDRPASHYASVCRVCHLDHAADAYSLTSGAVRGLQHYVRALYAANVALPRTAASRRSRSIQTARLFGATASRKWKSSCRRD